MTPDQTIALRILRAADEVTVAHLKHVSSLNPSVADPAYPFVFEAAVRILVALDHTTAP